MTLKWRRGCSGPGIGNSEEDAMRHPRCPATLALVVLASIGFAAGVAVSAQTDAASNRSNEITVTGCIRSTDQIAVGTSGSDGSSAGTTGSRSGNDSSTKFVLTNLSSSESSGETAGTSGTKAASTASGYRLDAEASKLTPHVGRKVEISGTVANPGSTSPGDALFGGAPRLKVISIRAIGSDCTR
jgi:hypothetical protein